MGTPRKPGFDRMQRNLIKAFTFAGAILGAGAIGLAKAIVLLSEELGWISHAPGLGPAVCWILAGAAIGFVGSYILIRTRRRQ